MENNDYTSLDYFLPPVMRKGKVINEDVEGGAPPAGAAPAPVMITNPPAESNVASVSDPIPAWITDGIRAWEELLEKNPDSKEIKAELERMKAMLPKAAAVEESASARKPHKVTIEVETSNAEFDRDEERALGSVLGRLVSQSGWMDKSKIMDINGNSIGTINVVPV